MYHAQFPTPPAAQAMPTWVVRSVQPTGPVGIAPSDENSLPLLGVACLLGLFAGYVVGGYVGVAAGAFTAAMK